MRRVFIEMSRLGDVEMNEREMSGDGLRMRVNVPLMLESNLTKTQKSYIMLYYNEKRTISEIACLFGVNKSTVSRTIKRGRLKIERALGMVS